ncbi:hypothetical protein [Dictyobacter aurantiacus]|uniref:hypothetical protein n=1 Tax=Dictyobacter aurantiacus TaxID=1936993 RepID=UPI000F82EC4A|nr:hypothetical protein [Dictyobacter aurantiacus]
MYTFSLGTLLYVARIRQLKGTFRSAVFYGCGDFHDPCVAIVTVQSGVMLSCNIYNRFSQIIDITEGIIDLLYHTIVEWFFDDATDEHIPSFNSPSTPSSPDLSQSSPIPGSQMGNPQQPRTSPLKDIGNPQQPNHFPSGTFSYSPATKNPSGSFAFPVEPHSSVPPHNNRSQSDGFHNLIPHRIKAVPRSEILQWKENVKSIYMRINGINTIAQIASMLSLPVWDDVRHILLQLEKDGLIVLKRPV